MTGIVRYLSSSKTTKANPMSSTLAVVVVMAILGCTTTTIIGVEAQNFSASAYLIANTYNLNATAVNCPSLDGARCNATVACWWNETLTQCYYREAMRYNGTGNITSPRVWCTNHFPLPFIALVYLSAAFLSGFALSGAIYNAMWYDTYSRINDIGERQFNQFYYATTPINLYMLAIVISALIMAVLSLYNLSNEEDCSYVAFVYIYLAIVLIPAIVYLIYRLVKFLTKYCKKGPENEFTVDHFCVPKTQTALDDSRNNQVRSF